MTKHPATIANRFAAGICLGCLVGVTSIALAKWPSPLAPSPDLRRVPPAAATPSSMPVVPVNRTSSLPPPPASDLLPTVPMVNAPARLPAARQVGAAPHSPSLPVLRAPAMQPPPVPMRVSAEPVRPMVGDTGGFNLPPSSGGVVSAPATDRSRAPFEAAHAVAARPSPRIAWQVPQALQPETIELPATEPDAPTTGVDVPPPQRTMHLPLGDPSLADRVKITGQQDRISLTIRDAPLSAVLGLLAEQHQLNIVASDDVSQQISATLTDVRLEQALDALLSIHGYTWSRQDNIILVTQLAAEQQASPLAQGQVVQVFSLDYVASQDIDLVVKGLLSPVGQSFTRQTNALEVRKATEQIAVADLPAYVQRVADYIHQVDQPPRQVEVEVHVLQVNLTNANVHGVNFQALARVANAKVAWSTVGLANPTATTASFLRVPGTDLQSLIEALKSTTDSKTLASPKLTVLNGQDGKIQIGAKLGYKTLQQNQTSTLQNVNFLETGVILKVTPIITEDGQVLLKVNPSVSDGLISPDTGLPNSNTTEVNTNVLLGDGEAIVLGGLIKESDDVNISRIPYLGDMKYIGFLFRRSTSKRQRNEIIITLLPRIVPDVPGCRSQDCAAVEQATTPLMLPNLERLDRTQWEPGIPQDTLWRRRRGSPQLHGATSMPGWSSVPQESIDPTRPTAVPANAPVLSPSAPESLPQWPAQAPAGRPVSEQIPSPPGLSPNAGSARSMRPVDPPVGGQQPRAFFQ